MISAEVMIAQFIAMHILQFQAADHLQGSMQDFFFGWGGGGGGGGGNVHASGEPPVISAL